MEPRRAIHIILNPIAGAGHRGLLEKVLVRLKSAGADVTVQETEGPGHGTLLARLAAERGHFDAIVAAGGDGTINEVARGLLGHGTPLGIIPLGTANVLAAELGLKPRAREVADMLLLGPAHLIGTGLIDGRIFLLMVGAGFDGELMSRVNPRIKRVWGKCAVVLAGVREWLRGPGHPVRLTIDGRDERAAWVVIVNARHYAGPYVLVSEADLSHPGLYAVLFRRSGRWAFVRYLAALGLGRVSRLADVDVVPVRRIEISGPEGLAVEVDGDAMGHLPRVVERGVAFLRLIVPQGTSADG